METEADIPEGSEPISVTKIEEETNELNCNHLDRMVSKVSSLGELQKFGNEHCLLTSETVEKSMNTEDKDEASQNFNDNINNHILEEKVESIEGETFFKSTAVANATSDQSIQGSEICEDKEIFSLVQKEDVVDTKDVKETHDITSMNNIVAFDKHGTSMTLENAKSVDEEEIAHSSKLPTEVNTTDICTAENYMSIPNITSTSAGQCVQEEKFEVKEGGIMMEEEKQTSEEIYDDTSTLVKEIDKEEILQHQHVESSTAEAHEQRSAVTEEVTTISHTDGTEGKIEVPSFELREKVGKIVETTLDHNESVNKLEVSKEESTGSVTLTNGEDKENSCNSDNIPIEQDVFNDGVTQTKGQEEAIMFSAEPEEKEKLQCASSQALEDIKDVENACQEEVVVVHETDDINEYTDNQIIREDECTKYQSSTTLFEEDMVQMSQADEEVEMKQDTKLSVGIEVDRATKNPTEKVIEEKEVIEDHCEASTGAEIVQKDNQEEEKEANKPEEQDSTGTHTTITVEDIHEDTFENNDVVNDYCTESDSGKSITKSSHEDSEEIQKLEEDEAKKNIVEQIIQENEAVENYHEASIGEETTQKANQKDENKAKECIKEDYSGIQTITAYEDTQEHTFDNNATNENCIESHGEKIVNIEENNGEDLERKLLKVKVFGGLETNANTTSSEKTSKQIFKDDVVMSLFPVSIDEDEVKRIHALDESHEKIEGVGDAMTTTEHNVQEDVIATDLPAISLLENIIRNGCQEDEECNKEPETRWGYDDAVKEYVEANGDITDISTIAIGEGTTVKDSHEEENKSKSEGKDKECDLKPKGMNLKTMIYASDGDQVNLDNEKEPNNNPIGCVNAKVSGEEIQREWNVKPVDYSLVSEVYDDHIKKEISDEDERIDDELKINVSHVNENISFNEAEPEGVKPTNISGLPSVMGHVPIDANEITLEVVHVKDLKLGKKSSLDKKADNVIIEKENADQNRARYEIKYYMTHGSCNAIIPEYKEDGAEPILRTEAAAVMILPVIESEMLQETFVLSSEQLNPDSIEADMTIKDDTPTEDQTQEGVQETPVERTKEEEKEASNEETIDVQDKKLETIQPREIINNEHIVEGEILKDGVEEVLKHSIQKDLSEVDKQEGCVDLISKGIDTADSSANGDKDTSDKVEGGEENMKESIKEGIQNGELGGIEHTRNQTALQEEDVNLIDLASKLQNLQTADSCEMFQNGETDTLWKDRDDTFVSILKPKEDDHKEAESIEATEESTENGTLYHTKADGLVESVERESGKLEPIDMAEKLRVVSETKAGDRSSANSTETEREGQTVVDQQHTGYGENHLVVQNTQEENMEAEKFRETRPSLKPEETDPQVYSLVVKGIHEFQIVEKSEEIEKQFIGKDVAARLYVVSTSEEAVKKDIDAKESNEKKEITTVKDDENLNSKPDVASMTKESEVEKPKKVVDNELSITFALISEVSEENNQETAEDFPDMANTESALVETGERSSQPVELEYEKIMSPAGICSEEKILEPVETIEPIMQDEIESEKLEEKSELMLEPPSTLICEAHDDLKEKTETSLQKVEPESEKTVLPFAIGFVEKNPEIVETGTILVDEDIKSAKLVEKSELISRFSSTGDENVTQQESIEDNLGGNKFEEEIKDLVPTSDALYGSGDQREEGFDNAAEKTKENLQEYSALMSETQDVGTLKDNPTIIDASNVEHNPELEVESIVCQNVEADKNDAHEKIRSLEVKSIIHNEDNSAKMNSSVEEKLVGEVGEECNEASNLEESQEFVSEAQTRDMLLKTKGTENDEDVRDVVPVGDENIGEISLEETTTKEHLMEENEYLKIEITQEVCARPENSDTSESNEKQIQGEEGFIEEPCPISVGKDNVTESFQEDHAREPFMETHMKLEPVESGNDPIADQIAKTNEATEIIKNGTLIEEIQGLDNDNAEEKTEMLITREEEVSKIILEEMNKESTVSTETREIVSAKNEEGPYMKIHENPTNGTPCEAESTESMHDMVVKLSSLELEEATSTNSETKISATKDARDLENLSEGDIPDKEENDREHKGEHIETQSITAVKEFEHVKNDVPEANILKEGVKKHDEFNIQERSCESQDTQIQIPQHEENQVVLEAEQETIKENVTARTGNNDTSESFVEDQSQLKTHLKQEAKVCESETTESSISEEFAKPEPEGLSADQPSATKPILKETTGDATNEEERSREVDLGKATEANTAILLDDQSRSTKEKNNLEEQKPRDISEINGKPKEAQCGEYKESISEIEPSMSGLVLDFERESSVEKKESLESKVPLTVQLENDAKEEEKYSADADDEQVKEDSGSDAPVMVEASADVDVKPTHKKSHYILYGVGSKVKHSIAKVKKVITGKSSSHKSSSPKKENESAVTY